jgi:D-amino-acid dehydrogenase
MSVARANGGVGEKHVVVVGGGVIGVCSAYFLARRGARVTLLERGEIAGAASYGNAGVIAAGHLPLNKPGRVRHALRLVTNRVGPLYIAPRWDPDLLRWLLAFRAACTEEHLEANMRVLGPLGHVSLDLFSRLVSEEGLDCGYRPTGYYEVCRTREGLASVHADAERLRRYGYTPEALEGEALREREPCLRDDTVGGALFPQAATCDPRRFVLELAERAQGRGAELRSGEEVTELVSAGGRARGVRTRLGETLKADAVVLATGAYSRRLTRSLGVRLPLQPAKGYHRDLAVGPRGAPPLGITCVLTESLVFCAPLDGMVRFAGTLELSGLNHEVREERLEQLTKAASEYLADVALEDIRSEWVGLRPCTPDGLPVVGPIPGHQGVCVATGHAMMGLTLGPVSGQVVADYVLEGRSTLDVQAMRVDRF